MTPFMLAAILAVTVEALVEYSKSILACATNGGWKTAVIQVTATVLAVLLCVWANADVFCALGVPLGEAGGCVLTGVFVARGSNYLADFIRRLTTMKTG